MSNKFNFIPDPLIKEYKQLREDGLLTHIAGLIFFLTDKYKGDKVRLRLKGNELLELAKRHGLPKALNTQLAKAVSMQR